MWQKLTWALCFAFVLWAVAVDSYGAKQQKGLIKLEISLDKKVFTMGEDIGLDVKLTNLSDKDLRLVGLALWDHPWRLSITVKGPTGESAKYVGLYTLGGGSEGLELKPKETKVVQHNIASFYRLPLTGEYTVQASHPGRGRQRLISNVIKFKLVDKGKVAFRKDIKITRARPKDTGEETVSLIVYAFPGYHIAYCKWTFEEDGKRVSRYKRLVEVDPTQKPDVMQDKKGKVHVLLAERPWTEKEIKQKLSSPRLQRIRMEHLFYREYESRFDIRDLGGGLRRTVKKKEKVKLRMIRRKEGHLQLRKVGPDGKDRGYHAAVR